MSRIREDARGAPLTEATRYALARTGPVITSAGIILAGTFSALMTLPLQDLLQFGFGVAAGVLIDTFVTRTLIVPSVVSMVGRWNWWAFPHRILTCFVPHMSQLVGSAMELNACGSLSQMKLWRPSDSPLPTAHGDSPL